MVTENFKIIFEADNGLQLQERMREGLVPDIIIMDINMPGMDGFDAVTWLNKNYPSVKVLVVSMLAKEETIVRMLKLGVKGYLCKDVEPKQLAEALNAINNKGYYYTDFITGKLLHSLMSNNDEKTDLKNAGLMTEREKAFLQLACSELTYHEIASKMFLSPKTIDGYRDSLFNKLNVKSRVGLALFAVKNGLVEL
jgi:DNA-binding NarL/FixJ family response regulator